MASPWSYARDGIYKAYMPFTVATVSMALIWGFFGASGSCESFVEDTMTLWSRTRYWSSPSTNRTWCHSYNVRIKCWFRGFHQRLYLLCPHQSPGTHSISDGSKCFDQSDVCMQSIVKYENAIGFSVLIHPLVCRARTWHFEYQRCRKHVSY